MSNFEEMTAKISKELEEYGVLRAKADKHKENLPLNVAGKKFTDVIELVSAQNDKFEGIISLLIEANRLVPNQVGQYGVAGQNREILAYIRTYLAVDILTLELLKVHYFESQKDPQKWDIIVFDMNNNIVPRERCLKHEFLSLFWLFKHDVDCGDTCENQQNV